MQIDHPDRSKGELPDDYAPYFQGQAQFQHFASPFGDRPAVFAVHFEAGGRTRPHVHRSGQVLYITDGEGIVADQSGRRVVRPGDVVTIRPDEWHWHGGTPTSAMTHLTVQVTAAGDIDWDVDEGDWASDYGP
ncbi:MAG TPA: cupin domain-containing protein [Nitriliruptorales bacterium]|nr:cupin domain-containing protein [Nitriliruptorales bacterium]